MLHASPHAARAPRMRSVGVGNVAGEVTSDGFTVPGGGRSPVVLGLLQVGVAAPGQNLVISATLAGEPPFAYQWLRNGQAIAGAIGVGDSPLLQLTTPVLTPADNGVRYSVVVANAAGSVRSPDVVISVSAVGRVAAGASHTRALSANGQVFASEEVAAPLTNGSTVLPSPPRVEGLSSNAGIAGIAGTAAGDGFALDVD